MTLFFFSSLLTSPYLLSPHLFSALQGFNVRVENQAKQERKSFPINDQVIGVGNRGLFNAAYLGRISKQTYNQKLQDVRERLVAFLEENY